MSSARLMTLGAFGGFGGLEVEDEVLSPQITKRVNSSAVTYAGWRKETKLLGTLHRKHGTERGSEMYMEYFAVEVGVIKDILHNVSDVETRIQYRREAIQAHGEVLALRRDQHGR